MPPVDWDEIESTNVGDLDDDRAEQLYLGLVEVSFLRKKSHFFSNDACAEPEHSERH